MVCKADLHIHTTNSDGTCTPEEVVCEAVNKGLSAIAITDHDITDGIEDALKAGAKQGIEVIPGIELSCEYNGEQIHMLGFYINWENSWFQEKLDVFQKARRRRGREIIKKFSGIGIDINKEELFSRASEGSLSRIHFARYLVEKGFANTISEGFGKYLEEGKPAFVKKLRITPQEALSMIHRVGGVSVIAHPVFGGRHKAFLKKMKRLGLCGIEVYHPEQDSSQSKRLKEIACELGLVVTGGSDSHGKEKEENPVGSVSLDYRYVKNLKKLKADKEKKNKCIMK